CREVVDRAFQASPADEHPRGVALHLLGSSDEPDLDRDTCALEMARDDEAVATIVASPSDHDHRATRLAEAFAEHARGAGAGALHEDLTPRPVLDRPSVERPHLRGGDGDHDPLPIAAFISRTASAMPTKTARV